MPGTLTVCATPIGNLGDLSPRAIEALKTADLIAAEDTRRTRGLLAHFGIHTPLVSCHKDNEADRSGELIARLADGQNIVLVSDAGTPAVSDPGEFFVRKCREQGIPVTAIPGPAARGGTGWRRCPNRYPAAIPSFLAPPGSWGWWRRCRRKSR